MNIYEKLANLVRAFDSIDLLASEIESLVDHTETVETIDELVDFLQTELEYANE